jgi:hypothetical protein
MSLPGEWLRVDASPFMPSQFVAWGLSSSKALHRFCHWLRNLVEACMCKRCTRECMCMLLAFEFCQHLARQDVQLMWCCTLPLLNVQADPFMAHDGPQQPSCSHTVVQVLAYVGSLQVLMKRRRKQNCCADTSNSATQVSCEMSC